MKAYFMRHGQTNYNVLKLCNDDPTRPVNLTEKGISQAEEAAQRLRGVKFDRIIVSELPRARQTADIVNRHHGVPVNVHPGLNDFRTGLDGEAVSKLYETIARDPMNTRIAGGETLTEHKQRILRFIDWLRQQEDRVVMVVAHEETLRVVTAHFRRLSDEAMLALKFDNTEILEFLL